MKKIVSVFSAIILAVSMFSSCSSSNPRLDGMSEIEDIRAEIAESSSGEFNLIDEKSLEKNQYFAFWENEDGTQSYYSENYQNDVATAIYSDGEKVFRVTNDSETEIFEGDPEYLLCDSKKNRHPYSTGQLLFYVPEYVESNVSMIDNDAETAKYLYSYDVQAINEQLGTELMSFSTIYEFDTNGEFINFVQYTENLDGSFYNYMITFSPEVSVQK